MRAFSFKRAFSSLPTSSPNLLSSLQLNHILQLCSNSKALPQGKQLHQHIILCGLDHHPFMLTKLVQMYADCGDLGSAQALFDKLSQPNVFAWTAILGFYSRNGLSDECVKTYCEMKLKGVLPDSYVFPKVFKACGQLLWFELGIQVHKDVVVFGCEFDLQVRNSLIDLYSKSGDVGSGRRVFDEMVERDVLSWNSMISGYVSNGFLEFAVGLLPSMRIRGFKPDIITWNAVMDAYCRMGLCDEAWEIFEQIKEPNIISWTTLVSGYSRIGNHERSLVIFRKMMSRRVVFPDLDSLASVLVSCRHLGALLCGREIHGYGIKSLDPSWFYKSAGPALLTMYARGKRKQDAVNVFGFMDRFDVVAWNAMILGFVDLGLGHLALECFSAMQRSGIMNNQITISTVLPACDLNSGKQIHAYITKSSLRSVISVCNASIHMYSKCGCIRTAYSVFSNMISRDLVSWNTMIRGFGMHGLGKSALQLLQDMSVSDIRPNCVTFTSALSACSHSGLVDEGLELFLTVTRDYGFNPRMEHFSCVVDLFARADRLEDAAGFIERMPLKPNKHIWGALLTACQTRENVSVAKLAAEKLFHLEPEHSGNYVALSNIYARAGRWDDALAVRKQMGERGLVKPSGYSWI